jgi:hypothetical protein
MAEVDRRLAVIGQMAQRLIPGQEAPWTTSRA